MGGLRQWSGGGWSGPWRGRRRVLTVRYGGGFLLALAGLGWRCWVRNLMVLALCVLLFQGIWYGLQAPGGAPRVRGRWPEIVLGLAGGAALVGLALFLLLFVFFLRDYDRVSEWEGQTVVAEYRGIEPGEPSVPQGLPI